MKKLLLALITIITAACSSSRLAPTTIHTIGDSTMADYDENTTQIRGWGEMFGHFTTDKARVLNFGRAGRSTKTFYNEGLWGKVCDSIKAGDYVIIQFAHNDAKDGGIEGESGRGTAPWSSYQDYLRKYVNETRARKATPIFVGPIVRCWFGEDGKLTEKGKHNLSESQKADDTTLNYVAAMKAVAQEMNVPYVDITERTRQIAEGLGAEDAKKYIYVSTDNTHTQAYGAAIYARATAQELIKNGLLKGYVKDNSIAANPLNYNFGNIYTGNEVSYSFDVSQLTDDIRGRHTYSVESDEQIEIAWGLGGKRSHKLEADTTSAVNFYAFITPKEEGAIESKINVKAGDKTETVVLKANAIEPTERLPLNCYVENFKDRPAQQSSRVSVPEVKGLVAEGNGLKPTSGSWSAEIDEVGNRYVEIYMAMLTNPVTINEITIDADEDMCYRIAYARSKDFYPRSTIGEKQSVGQKVITYNPNITVPVNARVVIRIFPWSKTATDKALNINSISIKGVAYK